MIVPNTVQKSTKKYNGKSLPLFKLRKAFGLKRKEFNHFTTLAGYCDTKPEFRDPTFEIGIACHKLNRQGRKL